MRVISGKSRGTKINTIESITTRPTLDRVKESLFNIIQNNIKDKIVLDLFAGSGALGIESLSRGAQKAYFCDSNKEAIRVIKQNLTKTKLAEKSKIYNEDFIKCLNTINEKIDIVFLDPPYKLDLAVKAVKEILRNKLLNDNGIIIIETDEINRDLKELEELESISITDKRKYGRANLIFINEEK